MGATSFLSNAGIVSRGIADTAYEDSVRREDISARQQTARMRGQQEQVTQMGLEDATRTRGVDSAVRRAGVAAGTDGGVAGTFDAMAAEADRHDPLKALQIRQAKRKLLDEGTAEIIKAAMSNDSLGNRPDLAQIWNTYGQHKADPARTQLVAEGGDRVLKTFDTRTGQAVSLPIGQTARALGLVKKPETQVLKRDERLINKDSGNVITAAEGDPGKFHMSGNIIYNDRSGTWQEAGQGEWKLGNVTNGNMEVPIMYNSRTREVEQLGPGGTRTGLQAHVQIAADGRTFVTLPGGQVSEFKPGTEARPASGGFMGFGGTPAAPGQPSSLQPVNPPQSPPVQGAQKAPDGKWYVRHGNGWAEVVVQGAPGAPAAPGAPPAAAAPKPVPKQSPTPGAPPMPAPIAPAAQTVSDDVSVPQLEPDQPTGSPKDRMAAKRAENAAKPGPLQRFSASMKAGEGQRVAEAFRTMVKDGTFKRSDAKIIQEAIDSGLLNPRETQTAQRMLAQLQPQTAGR